jgi:hypothetical protein
MSQVDQNSKAEVGELVLKEQKACCGQQPGGRGRAWQAAAASHYCVGGGCAFVSVNVVDEKAFTRWRSVAADHLVNQSARVVAKSCCRGGWLSVLCSPTEAILHGTTLYCRITASACCTETPRSRVPLSVSRPTKGAAPCCPAGRRFHLRARSCRMQAWV